MEHKLIVNADARKTKMLPPESVDLTITSPPYNLGMDYGKGAAADNLPYADYMDFTERWLNNLLHWSKPHGRLCINVPLDIRQGSRNEAVSTHIIWLATGMGWTYHSQIIWNKRSVAGRTAWGSWKSATAPHIVSPLETIIVLYKGPIWKREAPEGVKSDITANEFKEYVFGRWDFNGISGKDLGNHPAPFPVELPKRCIKLFSFPGDTVLDPFMGTGTTAIACIKTNRRSIGFCHHRQLHYPPHESGIYFTRLKKHALAANHSYEIDHHR